MWDDRALENFPEFPKNRSDRQDRKPTLIYRPITLRVVATDKCNGGTAGVSWHIGETG